MRRNKKPKAVAANQEIGRDGERLAAQWYVERGYRIVDRNWRIREGEIDLILERDRLVAFCEVKTRTSSRFGRGAEAVDWRKQRQVRALARRWLAASPSTYRELRFDVADVDGDGDLDALVGNATIGDTNVPLLDNLYINDGNGVFTDETATRWPQAVLSNTYGVSVIDIDRDGDLDILTAENIGETGVGSVRAYANDGAGVFSEQTTQLLGEVLGNVVDIEVADFNGDGTPDLYFCSARNFGVADSSRDFLLLGQ